MPRPKKEIKVEEAKVEDEGATTSLRRSSRSTRGSIKPVVDLTKIEKEIEEATEERPKKQKNSSRKSIKPDLDKDIVDLVNISDKSEDEDNTAQVVEDCDNDEVEELDEEDDEEPEEEDDDDEEFEEPKSKRSSRGRKSSTTGTKKKEPIKSIPKASTKGVKKTASASTSKTTKAKADKKANDNERSDEVEILYQLNEKEMKEINQAFDMNCSSDGDEKMTSEDLKTAIRSLGFEPRADEIQKLVEKFSTRSGIINRDGFHKIMSFKLGSAPGRHDDSSNDEISKVFNLLDLDKTGMITMANLRSISKELNEDITDEELHEMIAEADFDGDLMINKQEFYNIMKKTSLY